MSSAFVAQSQWNMSEYPKIARLLKSNVEIICPNILTNSKIHIKLRALTDFSKYVWWKVLEPMKYGNFEGVKYINFYLKSKFHTVLDAKNIPTNVYNKEY